MTTNIYDFWSCKIYNLRKEKHVFLESILIDDESFWHENESLAITISY